MNNCCNNPTPKREHFAFRVWGNSYSCFGGLFPSDSCLNCGSANVDYGRVRTMLFSMFNWFMPWDGAMCPDNHGED